MIIPPKLKKNDLVAIVSPSGRINSDLIDNAKSKLEQRGYRVIVFKNAKGNYFQYAAKDSERLDDFQQALDDPNVGCIFCARGGYGAIRIVDKLDFSSIKKSPKWLVGFSDITILHSALQNIGLAAIHGPMANSLSENDIIAEKYLFQALEGNTLNYDLIKHPLNREGEVRALLIGGNLSVLAGLIGTPYMPRVQNKILFIEDINEYLYRLDRIMWSFKLAGILEQISGLIVGGFTDMQDNVNPFGKNAYEIIYEHVAEYDYPVAFNFSAGHISENQSLVLGAETKLLVAEKVLLEQKW
jgi:muramoyltetrapeptide carboxypeptidase